MTWSNRPPAEAPPPRPGAGMGAIPLPPARPVADGGPVRPPVAARPVPPSPADRRMFRRLFPLPAAALAAGLLAVPALADHHEKPPAAADGTAQTVPNGQILALIVPKLQVGEQVGRFAMARAVGPDVQEYARRTADEHTALIRELRQAARRAHAHGGMTKRARRAVEGALRDPAADADGEVTEEEAEEIREELEEIREERAEAVEDVREERIDSLGDVADEARRDVAEAADAVADEVADDRGAARRARRMNRGVADPPAGRKAGTKPNLQQEIADRMVKSLEEALGRQSGRQFDMGYLQYEMLSHLALLDTLAVAEEHAGPEMKTALADAVEHAKAHLAEARQLTMKVDELED